MRTLEQIKDQYKWRMGSAETGLEDSGRKQWTKEDIETEEGMAALEKEVMALEAAERLFAENLTKEEALMVIEAAGGPDKLMSKFSKDGKRKTNLLRYTNQKAFLIKMSQIALSRITE